MTGAPPSALYAGEVTHTRLAPRRHRLRYRMFQLLLDLDDGPALAAGLRLFGWNRPGLFSFHERDHGDGRSVGLKGYVLETLAGAGIDLAGGRVSILCMPRMLGHVFNPLSVYYCRRADGSLAAMLYEVNNTFGQRHSYLIPVAESGGGDIRQACAKAFYVSPFMDMAMRYAFRLTAPGERLATAIQGRDLEGRLVIAATFAGARRRLDDRALASAFLAYPLLTLKVVAAIHWEAARLALKGLRLRTRPPAPDRAVSLVRSEAEPPAGVEADVQRRPGDVPLVHGGHQPEPGHAPAAKTLVGEKAEDHLASRRRQGEPALGEGDRVEVVCRRRRQGGAGHAAL